MSPDHILKLVGWPQARQSQLMENFGMNITYKFTTCILCKMEQHPILDVSRPHTEVGAGGMAPGQTVY